MPVSRSFYVARSLALNEAFSVLNLPSSFATSLSTKMEAEDFERF